MDLELLQEIKKIPENIRENIHYLDAVQVCYERDENISDENILIIVNKAYKCWQDDDYANASIGDYTDYLLEAIYDYNATYEEIDDLDSYDIVEHYNNEDSAEDILKYDTSNLEFCFSTKNGNRYYCDDEGLYTIDKKGKCIREAFAMSFFFDDVFYEFEAQEIEYIDMSLHYYIREYLEGELELEKSDVFSSKGFENYKKYCKENYITNKDIEIASGKKNHIIITDNDIIYSDEEKLNRLSNVLKENNLKNSNDYKYVASFENGTDYYYSDGIYLAIDKNNVLKSFEEEDNFLLKEMPKESKIIYISKEECEKIVSSLYRKELLSMNKKEKSWEFKEGLYASSKLANYIKAKSIPELADKPLVNNLFLYAAVEHARSEWNKELNNRVKTGIKKSKEREIL